MMKPIPIGSARSIAQRYGYDQVIIIARKVGDDGGEHVTTYGVDPTHCGVAARVGNFLKHKVMGWPEFPGPEEIVMPRKASERMIASMNAMAQAMLDAVGKFDVSLVYGTAVQCEVGRLQLLEAGMDEDGNLLAARNVSGRV